MQYHLISRTICIYYIDVNSQHGLLFPTNVFSTQSVIPKIRFLYIASCLLLFLPSQSNAQEWVRAREHHAWARFEVHSWKTTKILTDLIDDAGNITSTVRRETTTRLLETELDRYILEVESTVQIGEQKVNHSNQKLKRDINTQGEGFSAAVEKGTLKIGRKDFKVDIRIVTLHTKQGKRVSRVSFCEETTPHVLKRTTTYYDKKSAPRYTTTSAVTEFGVKQDVLGDAKTVCRIVTTHKQNGTTTITDELYCTDIPGGIIAQKIIETNADDQITLRTTLELTNYAIGAQESRLPKKEPADK